MHKFITIEEVCAATTLGKSEVYRRAKEGLFPAPVKIGTKRSAWLEAEIQKWISDMVEARATAGAQDAQEA